MKYTRMLLALLLVANTATAHRDTILTIHSDGSLEGLAEEYEPAQLTWSGVVPALKIRIRDNETVLPKCLTTRLSLDLAEITAQASWYHPPRLLPPYLVVNIVHSRNERGFFSGYAVLVNLGTGELIDLERSTATDSGENYEKLDLATFCSKREMANMVRVISR